jgi:hypothetical protein
LESSEKVELIGNSEVFSNQCAIDQNQPISFSSENHEKIILEIIFVFMKMKENPTSSLAAKYLMAI